MKRFDAIGVDFYIKRLSHIKRWSHLLLYKIYMYIAKYTTTKVATMNHLNDLNTDSIGQESQQSSNKLSFTFNNEEINLELPPMCSC